ncbi:MAG: ABC transporter permease subunit [Longispora sp.]|nr:ABC transporter permease subunit [Longispora sp. (in: high G+C Gram-positive bacteria)]
MLALVFLFPALLILGALVVYPILYTIVRSLYDANGDNWVGLGNYLDMFRGGNTLTAIKNNAIWVLVAPAVVTALGLIFAVLTERIKWATAFKALVFMPMAISFLASGIIFRLVYEEDPDRGLANAMLVTVHDTFARSALYPGARPINGGALAAAPEGALQTTQGVPVGQVATLGLIGISPQKVPAEAATAQAPEADPGSVAGVVWLDFTPGGGGQPGVVDSRERGLPGVTVEALRNGEVVGTAVTNDRGQFDLADLPAGEYLLRLPESNFREPFNGLTWLGPSLVTPAIIGSYIWIWAGFAMVLIGAGLAAIPREALEAARVDGATEWQVFRRVTVPLLAPVLAVVLVTLVINVLKVFDLVFIIAPGSSQDDATVLALEMWRVSFGGGNNQGLGSALAVFLFLLVLPAMIFNIRRFRREK